MKLIQTAATALVLAASTLVTANAATFSNGINQPPVTDSTDRTVVIDSSTTYVNVRQGEKLKFVTNGREFAIDFSGTERNFDLRKLAPAGTLDHEVDVYVEIQPRMMCRLAAQRQSSTGYVGSD
jgi:hypothetical protein